MIFKVFRVFVLLENNICNLEFAELSQKQLEGFDWVLIIHICVVGNRS